MEEESNLRPDPFPDLELLSERGLNFSFVLRNSNGRTAAKVRAVLMAYIPTFAIDCMDVFDGDNTSLMKSEELFINLTQIPFISSDTDDKPLSRHCDQGENFILDVQNQPEIERLSSAEKALTERLGHQVRITSPIRPIRATRVTRATQETRATTRAKIVRVTAADIINTNPQSQVKPVNPNWHITNLLPGQKIKVTCVAAKNIGVVNPKWSPVAAVGYQRDPRSRKIVFKDDGGNVVRNQKTIDELIKKGQRLQELVVYDFYFTADRTGALTADELIDKIYEIYPDVEEEFQQVKIRFGKK